MTSMRYLGPDWFGVNFQVLTQREKLGQGLFVVGGIRVKDVAVSIGLRTRP